MKIALTLFALFTCAVVFSQCTFKNLFPVSTGITKYQAINALSANPTVYEVKKTWQGCEMDSVKYSTIEFKWRWPECIMGDENIGKLFFENDILYEISIEMNFTTSNFSKCIANYDLIAGYLKSDIPTMEEFELVNQAHEQIGEGIRFHKDGFKKNDRPIKGVTIERCIQYEYGEISGYLLTLKYVDLDGKQNEYKSLPWY